MVTIVKGETKLTVSRGAYEGFYRRCGFTIREDAEQTRKSESTVGSESVYPGNSAPLADESASEEDLKEEPEDDESIDYSEIPLTELTFEQLCEYADQLGLDHEGIKSSKGLRALIKANR